MENKTPEELASQSYAFRMSKVSQKDSIIANLESIEKMMPDFKEVISAAKFDKNIEFFIIAACDVQKMKLFMEAYVKELPKLKSSI